MQYCLVDANTLLTQPEVELCSTSCSAATYHITEYQRVQQSMLIDDQALPHSQQEVESLRAQIAEAHQERSNLARQVSELQAPRCFLFSFPILPISSFIAFRAKHAAGRSAAAPQAIVVRARGGARPAPTDRRTPASAGERFFLFLGSICHDLVSF